VEETWNAFRDGLLNNANEVCGCASSRPRQNETWWWNNTVVKVVGDKRRLFEVWQKSKSETDKTAIFKLNKLQRQK
jgi:hypothetical protein